MTIQAKGITKRFQYREVVKNVDFSLEDGRCVALIGPNGAGKTTLLKILVGLLPPNEGEISLHKDADWKKNIGYLPQVPNFYGWMSAREFLMFMGKLSSLNKALLKNRVNEVLKITGIEDAADREINGFSGGMKQRLGLAQVLLHKPKYIFLDEPVSALDPVGRRDVMSILTKLKGETTIIYSTHVLHDAEEISDDVLLMKDGCIIAKGTLESFISKADHSYIIKASNLLPNDMEECSFIKQMNRYGQNAAEITLVNKDNKDDLLRWCLENQIDLIHFQQSKQTLENVFMEVIKE